MNMLFPILFAALGIYGIVMGIRIIVTGKLTASEEAKIKDFSEKGARTFKLLNAALNIVSGLLVIGIAIVRFLENQGIISNSIIPSAIFIGVLVVMLIVYFVVRNKCKNM